MSTIVCIDYRRTDQRTNVLENPYWITSGLVVGSAAEDKGALLFSFPNAKRITIVYEVVVQTVAGFTSSTLIDIGSGTIATDAITTGGDITIVDLDEYVKQGDDNLTAATCWGSTTGANASDWLTAAAAGTYAAPRFILGAATAVPVVYATLSNTGTIAAGTLRVHMLISTVPGI